MGLGSTAFLLAVQYGKKHLRKNLPITPESSIWQRITDAAIRGFHLMPHVLLAVIVGICITYGLRLDKEGLKVLGDQPHGLPVPTFPNLSDFSLVGKYESYLHCSVIVINIVIDWLNLRWSWALLGLWKQWQWTNIMPQRKIIRYSSCALSSKLPHKVL